MTIRKADYLYRSISPVNIIAPVISGVGSTGETLTATKGAWLNAFLVVGQWYSNHTPLNGENSLTYTVTATTSGSLFYYKETTYPNVASVLSNSILATWTPADITTALWLDAADASTITEVGGLVSQWDDKSGNGYDVTQVTGSKQPVTGATTIGGLNVIKADGVDDFMANILYPNQSQPFIRLFVFKSDTGSGGQHIISSTSSSQKISFIQGSTNFIGMFGTSSVISSVTVTTDTTIISNAFNGTSSILRVNGGSDVSGNTGVVTATGITIGASNTGGLNFGGDIGEVIEAPYTFDNMQKLEGYLAHKWGLVAELPSDHPYKNSPPTV
jgi:hypothetical protein